MIIVNSQPLNGFETAPCALPTEQMMIRIPIVLSKQQYVELLNMKKPMVEMSMFEEQLCGENVIVGAPEPVAKQ
jgi:hypothetical protein